MIKDILKNKHTPMVLTLTGIIGFAGCLYSAIKAYDVAGLIDPIEEPKEFVRVYGPTLGLFTLSSLMVLSARHINDKQLLATEALYALSHRRLMGYQNEVIESIGEEKHRELALKMNKKINPIQMTEDIAIRVDLNNTTVICMDSISGRTFYMNPEVLRRKINDLNDQLFAENTVTINDYFYELGLPYLPMGDSIGWSSELGSIKVALLSDLLPDTDIPCLYVHHDTPPTNNP